MSMNIQSAPVYATWPCSSFAISGLRRTRCCAARGGSRPPPMASIETTTAAAASLRGFGGVASGLLVRTCWTSGPPLLGHPPIVLGGQVGSLHVGVIHVVVAALPPADPL